MCLPKEADMCASRDGDSLHDVPGRRRFLATFGAFSVMASGALAGQMNARGDSALTKEQRDRLTASEILEELKRGNERFRSGKPTPHDYRDQKRTSAAGQYPAVAFLGCFDSRAPAEIIFDTG